MPKLVLMPPQACSVASPQNSTQSKRKTRTERKGKRQKQQQQNQQNTGLFSSTGDLHHLTHLFVFFFSAAFLITFIRFPSLNSLFNHRQFSTQKSFVSFWQFGLIIINMYAVIKYWWLSFIWHIWIKTYMLISMCMNNSLGLSWMFGGSEKSRLCEMLYATSLGALSANTASKLYVLRHDGDSFGVDGAQVGVFEKPHQISLACFLEGHDSRALEPQLSLEILGNFSHKSLERKLADEKFSALLIAANFS